MRLTGIKAIRSLDLHGRPAISVCVKTNGAEAWSQVRAGKNINKIIENFNSISKNLNNFDFQEFSDLKKIESKINSGKAIIVAVEYAILKAFSAEKRKPLWKILNPNAKKLPQLLVNVAGRQLHGHAGFDLNEILIFPQTKNISDAAFVAAGIFNEVQKIHLNNLPAETALEIIDRISGRQSCKIGIGIDVHGTQLCTRGKYLWKNFSQAQKGLLASEKKQIELVEKLANRFDLAYVEDPLHKDAFSGFRMAKARLSKYGSRLVAGDCLIAADAGRLGTALKQNSINAAVIDPLHAGSLIKTKRILDLARKNEINVVFEARDGVGAHLARAWQATFAKVLPFGAEINEHIQLHNGAQLAQSI